MRVALISGWMPTAEENGLKFLASRIAELGHSCQVFHYKDTIAPEFEILVGHSFGGWKATQVVGHSASIKYLGLIDPVDINWHSSSNFILPQSVDRADCFKRFLAWMPPSSVIINADEKKDLWKNYYRWMWHGSAPQNQFVIETILNSIKLL